jgi:MerR family transcriptional regulator, copper efflux regulator
MGRNGFLIGEVAAKGGVSRKALRLYERAGILPLPRRTSAGSRVYGEDTLPLLVFVRQARRLGFRLDEIKQITSLERSGRTPCTHVLDLVRVKLENIERVLTDVTEVREQLRRLLRSWRSHRHRPAAVCPCIEHLGIVKRGGVEDWRTRKYLCVPTASPAPRSRFVETRSGSARRAIAPCSRRMSGISS